VKAKLRVGVHNDVQVTSHNWGAEAIEDPDHTVTQVFCSACSVAYSQNSSGLWAPFASLVLEASYEATLWAALLHAIRHRGDPRAQVVYLTCVGGGVFGNDHQWIATAIDMACERVGPACAAAGIQLDCRMVTYAPGQLDRDVEAVISKWA
jgi:hypothetical protein